MNYSYLCSGKIPRKMKKFDTRTYLYIAAAGMVIILALVVIYMLTPVSKAETTQYVYIDDDDTQDSVIAKVGAFSHTAGMTGLTTLIRHSKYSDHIRTGRYAIEPNEGAFVVFRHLKQGRQTSMMLTIPEVRTMDRLAGFLGRKLMLDSATIATALYDQETCQKYGYDTCTIAAMFVPNSYDIYWNISIDNFLQRMHGVGVRIRYLLDGVQNRFARRDRSLVYRGRHARSGGLVCQRRFVGNEVRQIGFDIIERTARLLIRLLCVGIAECVG